MQTGYGYKRALIGQHLCQHLCTQVNLQPFQHETVAKIEWNAFAHASKQRKDYTINSSILTSLMDLDNATAAIDPHESLLLTHLRVTCKRFLDRSLAPSDQFMHGIRHLLLKAHGLPLAGAMDVLHEKLLSFAEFVVAEAKESGAPIGKREGKLVDEYVLFPPGFQRGFAIRTKKEN